MTWAPNAAILRMLERPFAVTAGAWAWRLVHAIGGDALERRLLHRIDVYAIRSGWPNHPPGWLNLHVSQWLSRSRRCATADRLTPRRPQPKRPGPWRVAICGHFSGLLSFPRDLFVTIPAGIDVSIFDLPFRGQAAEFLAPLVSSYVRFDEGAPMSVVSDAISKGDFDLLMVIGPAGETYDLVDTVEARAIVNYCTGSDLMHHERLDFQMHGQPQADYFVKDRRMFCGITRRPLSAEVVLPIEIGFYDRRSLAMTTGKAWRDREPLVVFHGSLYKAAQSAMLDVILTLLEEDRSLQFALIGKDDGRSLAAIQRLARARGVAGQVHYEGMFIAMRDADAGVGDPGWAKLVDLLQRGRLAADPFPIGGGSSRFEAYALGTPSVHLGVRFDEALWGRFQPAACDIVFLNTASGTVYDVADYQRLCRRCLNDGVFADALAAEQLTVARTLTDSAAWWQRLRSAYDDWSRQ